MSLFRRPASIKKAGVRRALLKWFRLHARPLPWRKSPSAYQVWVAEVMLQQTQMATVIPYYRRFLRAFPNVSRLAQAPLEKVLEIWSGLGYYRRARNMHLGAQVLTQKFGGRFPRHYDQACSLPGIGDYTARAVLSIAFNLPYFVLDGNVARVLARLRALKGHLHQLRFRRVAEQELERLLSRRYPGDFNQAMMELGQTICLPSAPRCPVCPVRAGCLGYRDGRPESYPAPRPRRATESRHLATAIIRRGQRVAMMRGLDEGLLGDLWNFPSAFGQSREEARARLRQKLAGNAGGPVHYGNPVAELRHRITFRSIRVTVFPAEVAGKVRRNLLRWFPLSRLPQAAVSQLVRRIAAHLA